MMPEARSAAAAPRPGLPGGSRPVSSSRLGPRARRHRERHACRAPGLSPAPAAGHASPGTAWPDRRRGTWLRPRGQLLERPGVAVRVAEGYERAPRLIVDVAGLHAMREQILPGGLDIRDDHLHTLLRAWRHLGDPRPHDHRAGRSGRGELHEPQFVTYLIVVVGVEPNLFHIERLGAVDVGHRYGHELDLPVHARQGTPGVGRSSGPAGGSGHDVGRDFETQDPRWRQQPGGLEEWPALFGERPRVAGRTPHLYHPRSFFIDTGNLAQAAIGRWRCTVRAADGVRKSLPVKSLVPFKVMARRPAPHPHVITGRWRHRRSP